MSIQRFRPEIWSALLLTALRKSLVYAGPGVVNRTYEGEIKGQGSTVKITSIGDPDISDYEANSTEISPQELTDAQRNLVIDKAKYFAFYVDDIDAAQALGNVMPEAMQRAAYKLRDQMDRDVAALYTDAPSANTVGSTSAAVDISTATDVYDEVLVPLSVKLDEADVPTEGRYVIIPPAVYGQLLKDDRFIRQDASGTTAGLRNGQVGEAAGFTIMKSNNVPTASGTIKAITAGTPQAISFAEQINKTEAYRPEAKFADAVKGLAVYGTKVLRPECLSVAYVDTSLS